MRLENQVNNYAPISTYTLSKLDFLCTLAVEDPTQVKKIASSILVWRDKDSKTTTGCGNLKK